MSTTIPIPVNTKDATRKSQPSMKGRSNRWASRVLAATAMPARATAAAIQKPKAIERVTVVPLWSTSKSTPPSVAAAAATSREVRNRRRSDIALDARDVALLSGVDLELVADGHEERHLDDSARLECGGLRDVRDGVAFDARLGVDDGQLDRHWQLYARRLSVHSEHLDGRVRLHEHQLVREIRRRNGELLVRLGVHEVHVGAVLVEELDVLDLGVDADELLACAERAIDGGAGTERLELGAHERAALARLHVLEVDDAPGLPIGLDVHPVLELVRVDRVSHLRRRV